MHHTDKSIRIFDADTTTHTTLPYADGGIRAGFPSPAQESLSESIDLNRELIKHPAATFFGRVSGDSMIEEGIFEDDILVIDRSLEPQNDDLAVCCIDGDFTLKRIHVENDNLWLIPANAAYQPILVTPDNEFSIWGIVTYTIHRSRRKRIYRK